MLYNPSYTEEYEQHYHQVILAHDDIKMQRFTCLEYLQMIHVPKLIAHMAWVFALRVTDYAVAYKLNFKRENRLVKRLHEDYIREIISECKPDIYDSVKADCENFAIEMQEDIMPLWFSMNNLVKKQCPDEKHPNMVTDALISILLIKLVLLHLCEVNIMATNKMGIPCNFSLPHYVALRRLMMLYCGHKYEYDSNIKLWEKVFSVHMSRLRYNYREE